MISDKAEIHPTAQLGENVEVGPWTVIGENVSIGAGTKIGPHAVILGPTKIGENNQISPFASLGDAPQDINYKGEPTELIIGNNNIIREYCTINRGTVKGGGLTKIGDNNIFMAYVHVAHDCQLGNQLVLASYAGLAGHVTMKDYVNVSAYAAIHQNCQIGESAFITKATYITKDVLPYVIVAGYDPKSHAINTVGIKRRGFSSDTVDALRRAYKIIFRRGLLKDEALEELQPLAAEYPPVQLMLDEWKAAKRGIVR